jgi:AcrR family transcriptional regulator
MDVMYPGGMPRLWTETIAAHRAAVQDAVLDSVAALVAEHGLASVSMSQVAERTGIGRATVYKYFPDVEAVLTAWHERQITRHLAELTQARDAAGPGPRGQLQAVLEAYALRMHQRQPHGSELAALLHQGDHVARAQQQLHAFLTGLVADAAREGQVRDDIVPGELGSYCLHALTAASGLPSEAAARRLVSVTLDGLRPVPVRPDATAQERSARYTPAARSGA